MRRAWFFALRQSATISCLLVLFGTIAAAQEQTARPCVVRAELDGLINPGTAEFLLGARTEAARKDCEVLLVALNTPGGTVEATRRIVGGFLQSEVPVVVYVSPAGARAGSAGALVTLSAHVAVMAPGTNIGAAHPVSGLGKDPEAEGGEHMAKKIENDVAALARAIARERGRNVEWAQAAVRESVSATAHEALEKNVIDRVVDSERELLQQLHGVSPGGDSEQRPLRLQNVVIHHAQMTLQQRALTFLGNPSIAYVLLMLGLLGIMIEVNSPGLIVPGALGGLALVLAIIGLNVLPVHVGGILLLVLAVGLFVAELHVPSFGLLTLGGLVLLALGSMLLIDEQTPEFFVEPDVGVSWTLWLPLATLMAAVSGTLAWWVVRDRRRRAATGAERLIGAEALTLTSVGPSGGAVRVHGERWQARASRDIAPDSRVRVSGLRGLQLDVDNGEEDSSS